MNEEINTPSAKLLQATYISSSPTSLKVTRVKHSYDQEASKLDQYYLSVMRTAIRSFSIHNDIQIFNDIWFIK